MESSEEGEKEWEPATMVGSGDVESDEEESSGEPEEDPESAPAATP